MVAEHADIWHSFGDAATIARKSAILNDHGTAVGRDASRIERSAGVSRVPGEVADAMVAAGVTLFTVGVSGPDYDLSLVKHWVQWRDAHA